MGKKIDIAERLKKSSKQDKSGCQLWVGCVNAQGNGFIWKDGRAQRAHRVAYELAHGPILKNTYVIQNCGNKACVNIEHLHLKSRSDTVRASIQKGRKHPDGQKMNNYYNGRCVLRYLAKLSPEGIIQVGPGIWGFVGTDFWTEISGPTWERSKDKNVIEGLARCRKAYQQRARECIRTVEESLKEEGNNLPI